MSAEDEVIRTVEWQVEHHGITKGWQPHHAGTEDEMRRVFEDWTTDGSGQRYRLVRVTTTRRVYEDSEPTP